MNLKIVLLLIVFSSILINLSQDKSIASKNSEDETNKNSNIDSASNSDKYEETYEKKRAFFLAAIANPEENDDQKFRAYFALAGLENSLANTKKAMEYAELMRDYAEKLNNSHYVILTINYMGLIQSTQGNYKQAITYFFEALKLAKQTSNTFMILAAKDNIALYYIDVNQFDKAILELNESLDIIAKSNLDKRRLVPNIYGNLCRAYMEKNEFEKAYYYCDLGLKFIKEVESPLSTYYEKEILFLLYKSNLEILTGNYQNSEDLLSVVNKKINLSLVNEKITLNAILYTKIYYSLYTGKLYFYQKHYAKAIDELLQTKRILTEEKKGNYTNAILEMNAILAKSYLKLDEKEKAADYFQKMILNYEAREIENNEILNQVINNYGLMEIEELQQTNSRKKMFMQISIFILSIFLILGLTRFIILRKQNNLRFKELEKQLSQQKQLSINLNKNKITSKKANLSSINIETQSKILNGLKVLENEYYFLNENCNTFNTAKKLQTNVSYLSKVIQHNYGCDFSTYINNSRINYTIKKLNEDSLFRSYSINAISKEVGYKSTNSFVKHFKKRTKLLPSYYIKKLKTT